ncbi:FAD-dependent oxidoreductase [Aspergillus glaucus CBS 516.65]|uniref:FAD-binding domain-containing protein n=1 Tax=Aspergillus glaucus CBS 516.65 TaxID=1160497 RepID=A0A1L9VHI7_ASPGL|nr:hypothetical protein ASPGLDRAFT_36168 [Aspergillus glaucus CBS 516.65]OJJ83398.1 hypothetical protein ASPGLDRAFT_36168 [Aspergillus glaucus CBS 516.65]
MEGNKKVIIIGAGICGLATAIRLRDHNGLEPVIYEIRGRDAGTLGGSLGIPCNGLLLLNRLGLWDSISVRGVDIAKTVLHSTSGGILKEVDVSTEPKEKTGFGYHRINRSKLMDCLMEGTERSQIPIHWEKQLVSINDNADSITVNFSDGTSDTAFLLLGCDGIHSTVRTLHVDPGFKSEYSGISAVSSIVDVPNPSDKQPCLHSTLTPQGMLASAPCPNDQTFWFFSKQVPLPSQDSEDARYGWSLHRQKEMTEFRESLSTVLDGVHGEWGQHLRRLVDTSKDVHFYPHYRLPLGGKWFKPGTTRCLLLGDAAHAMQPHAGQGVSIVMEDVFLISGLLKKFENKEYGSLEAVFAKFDEIRRPRIDKISLTAQRNGAKRKNQNPWAVWVKEWVVWGMSYVSSVWGMSASGVDHGDVIYDVEDELKNC